MLLSAIQNFVDVERAGLPTRQTLHLLRQRSLDEFLELLTYLPNNRLPHLSSILPLNLSNKSFSESNIGNMEDYISYCSYITNFIIREIPLSGKDGSEIRILDYDTDRGRITSSILYHVDAEYIFATPAETHTISLWHEYNVQGNLINLTSPQHIPIKFDLIFADRTFCSVRPEVAQRLLSKFRSFVPTGGLIIAGFLPVEVWGHLENNQKFDGKKLREHHRDRGHAFCQSSKNPDRGILSMDKRFLSSIAPGWRIKSMGQSFTDSLRCFAVLLAV